MGKAIKKSLMAGILIACGLALMPYNTANAAITKDRAQNSTASRKMILNKMKVRKEDKALNKKLGIVFKAPVKSPKFYIDISRWQLPYKINYNKLAKQIDGAILRIGTGDRDKKQALIKDKHFDEHYEKLNERGISLGCYWYSCAVSYEEGVEEAEEALRILGDRKLTLPIYFDTENRTYQLPAWKNDKNCLTEAAKGFCETIEKSGRKAGIYASAYWIRHQLNIRELSQYELWVANYVTEYNKDKPPMYKGPFKMWQYSSKLKLGGFSDGPIDSNWRY